MDFYDELKKVLGSKVSDSDLQADLLGAIDKLNSESVASLKTNKEDILNEKRTLQAKYDTLVASTAGLEGKTISDFKKLEEDIAKLRDNPGDEEKLRQLEDEYRVRIEALENDKSELLKLKDTQLTEALQEINSLKEAQNKTACSRELQKALTNVGVKDIYMANLMRSLLLDTFIKEVDGKNVVKFNGTTGNVTFDIMEGVQLWAKEPANQVYLGAPKSSGAGVSGSSSGITNLTKKAFKDMSGKEKTELYRADKALYEKARQNSTVAVNG